MDRRRFLGVVAGLAVAPVLPALPAPASIGNPLFRGELGRWQGISIIQTMQTEQRELNAAVRLYSAALAREIGRKSYFRPFLEERA